MTKNRGFEIVSDKNRKHKDVKLPLKATKTSAGYDFFCPIDIDIPPQEKVVFDTDIKAYMQPGEMLLIAPRSSSGIKHDLMIANTIVIGDCDFYNNESNEGNYKICLRNLRPSFEIRDVPSDYASFVLSDFNLVDLREENTVHINAGDRIVQGVFIQTLPADNGNSDNERTGGIGSTGV